MRAADAVREAFAIGWATSTARYRLPLTERARTACLAAMRVAESAPQPSTGPTLNLGQLEGVWAVIYARREAVEHLHAQALQAVLDAIKGLDWDTVLARLEHAVLLNPTISGRTLAYQLGAQIEDMIARDLPVEYVAQWRELMHAALLDATAEGQAAGMGLVADAAHLQIDWDLAASDAKKALADSRVLWDQSTGWLVKQTQGIGYQVSQKLAALWADGSSKDEMLAAIEDLLGVDVSKAAVILDTAIGQALSLGALDSYQLAGVAYADFVTAGDRRVCPACEDAEEQNPYGLTDVPLPPIHPSCRCTVSPSDYQPAAGALSLVDPYLTDMEAA